MSLWKRGAIKASRSAFEKKLKNKKDPDTLRLAGVTAFKDGDYRMAVWRLEELIRIEPKQRSAKVLRTLASVQ